MEEKNNSHNERKALSKEQVLKGVVLDKKVFFYADISLKNDKDFVKKVASVNPEAVVFAGTEILADVEYMKEILQMVKVYYDKKIASSDSMALIEIFSSYRATIELIGKACLKASL